jgi:CheY-like chemotaxis protein/two-component sensor histidine kinase
MAEQPNNTAHPPSENDEQMKLDFVALVSHELRMPVSAIIGYIELLEDGTYGELNDEQRRTLGYMSQNARDLLRMINDLLQLARMQAGRAQLTIEQFSARQLTDDVLRQMASLVQEKPVKLEAKFPDDLPLLRTDSGKLRQILVNLVSNAIKFTREGSVRVVGRKIPSLAADEKPWLELSVTDTGVGIPREKLGTLFKMFSQADNRVSRQFEGMGIGLYISQHLAHLLGGSISVESELGKGTAFTLRIPMELDSFDAVRRLGQMHKETTATTAVDDEPQRDAAGGPCVLVIGTDPNVPRLLGGSLKKEGFSALKATTAEAALKMIRDSKPRAIVADLTQSRNESFALLQQIRLAPEAANLPVIYLTDYSEAPPSGGAGVPLTVNAPLRPQEVVASLRKAGNQQKRILVADDDEWIRQLLETMLRDEGYQVALAANGREAWEMLRSEKPDVLLLDLTMPEISGWELMQKIFADESLRQTRVVVMTGQTLTPDEQKSVSQNIRGFLKKSEFKIEKILAEVRAVFQDA